MKICSLVNLSILLLPGLCTTFNALAHDITTIKQIKGQEAKSIHRLTKQRRQDIIPHCGMGVINMEIQLRQVFTLFV